MKFSLRLFVVAAVLCAPFCLLHGDEPKPVATPPTPTPQAKWNVRVEVFMVALPEEKALALLLDLRDEARLDGACKQLVEAVKRKEARLTGYPIVYANEGHRGNSETNAEKIYPTQFNGDGSPVNFEKRNLGPLLEAECQVSSSGEWIQIDALIQHTELLNFDSYGTSPRNGTALKIEQPRFFCAKDMHHLALHNGQRVLAGVHRLIQPEGEMELFILQATATAAH